MKTLFRTMTPLAFTAALFLFSACEKEPLTVTKPVSYSAKQPTTTPGHVKSCSPWRDVEGYNALVSELNTFALCDVRNCQGRSQTITYLLTSLVDSGGTPFSFGDIQLITPAEQNDVIAAGVARAVAHTPVGGYFVSQITYIADVHTIPMTTLTYANIDISVVYRKCSGGGGGEED